METHVDSSEEEHQYQYHETETETFLIDLDLSRIPSKNLNKSIGSTKASTSRVLINTGQEASDEEESAPVSLGKSKKVQRIAARARKTAGDLQILELDSENPIISYNNQIYDCSWTDMVGTNMFFDVPASAPLPRSGSLEKESPLIGTSRIKIAGSRAKLTKAVSQKRKHIQTDEDEASTAEQVLPGFASDDAQANIDIKKQAEFLETLMDVKKRRGEADLVTVLPMPTKAREPNPPLSEELRDEIDALNRRIVKGDIDALSELQAINTRLKSRSDRPARETHAPPVAGNQIQSSNPGTPLDARVHSDNG